MVSVEKFIEKLLLKHDCVIMPGLGGFVTHYEPPYRDEESGLFYPPTRTIGFNARLKINDGLLVQAYMQAFDTNYPEPNRMVEREIERVKELLHSQGAFDFDNLGLLELKADNELLFTPKNQGGIVAPTLYGLDAYASAPYVAPVKVTQPIETAEAAPTSRNDAAENINTGTHYTIRLNKAVAHYAAAAILAIIFYLAFPVTIANQTQQHNHGLTTANGALYGFPIQSLLEQVPNAQPIQKTSVPAPATACDTDSVKPLPENHTDTNAVKAKASYYTIVLASSIKEANAEIFVEQLKEKGLDSARVFRKNKMIRVIYSNYPTEQQAREALNGFHDIEVFENAWILQIN